MGQAVAFVFLSGLILVGSALLLNKPIRLDEHSLVTFLLQAGGGLIVGDVLFVIAYTVQHL